jgi:hypothetical protein
MNDATPQHRCKSRKRLRVNGSVSCSQGERDHIANDVLSTRWLRIGHNRKWLVYSKFIKPKELAGWVVGKWES